MTIITVLGDGATTTTLAVASAWPRTDDVLIVEADRTGGSLAAWLDTPPTPSLSTIVASSHGVDHPSTRWSTIDSMIREASGLRFMAAPVRSLEANRAIREANSTVFPMLAARTDRIALADIGGYCPTDELPALASMSNQLLVCHRQHDASAASATVRIERLAELVDTLAAVAVPITLALIGNHPFEADEVQRFILNEGGCAVTVHELPIDALAAAVLAGRTGVSERRLRRLPLLRRARGLVDLLRPGPAAVDRAPSERVDPAGAPR